MNPLMRLLNHRILDRPLPEKVRQLPAQGRAVHAFLRRHSFYPLAFCTSIAFVILAGRIAMSRTPQYAFLVWNLFLAWIPYIASLGMKSICDRRLPLRIVLVCIAAVWLLFFPNAPYIITDFVHLNWIRSAPIWYDVALLSAFAWTGCLLGAVSLRIVQSMVEARVGRVCGWLFALCILALSGVGMYMGRFLRWNSWDVFFRPHRIMGALSSASANPLACRSALLFSLLFAMLLLGGYVAFISMQSRREPGLPEQSTA